MRRRDFIALLGGGTVASLSFQAHPQTAKVPRIGYLSPAAAHNLVDEAFENALQQLGWVIDRNIKIEYRYTGGRQDKVAPIVAEIDGLDLDLFVAWGTTLPLAT